MTVKEFWESEEQLAIHCSTETQAIILLDKFDELGKKWSSGISYLSDNKWKGYKEGTCYGNDGHYCDKEFYENEEKIKVIEFDDLEDFKGQQTITKQDAMRYLKAMATRENTQYAQDTLEYFKKLLDYIEEKENNNIIDEIKRKYEANYYYCGIDSDGKDVGGDYTYCKDGGGILNDIEIDEDKDEVYIWNSCGGHFFKISEYGKTWFFSEELEVKN